jgi:exodeoxyribonuclease V gamma subunit
VLRIHRAERADSLAAALASLLATPLVDPFAPEVVSVPTRGMERWLTQRLSERLGAAPGHGDGVCANVVFPPPWRLSADALNQVTGVDPDSDPWAPRRILWPLLETIEASLGEPWMRVLARHLGASAEDRSRRLGTARHLADLFARYEHERPQMILAWAADRDEDAVGGELDDAARWQAELWRRLRARVGTPSFAERLGVACERLREEPALTDLPERLALFGLTRLPAAQLDVVRALAEGRDVHLYLLHPSPASWAAVAAVVAQQGPVRLRSEVLDRMPLPANPLLASWGRDARELQLALMAAGPTADEHCATAPPADSLLAWIQAAVRADQVPAGPPAAGRSDERPVLRLDDRSVQVHSCHGDARQVEVVRDAILHAMADDPRLEPRDVIVMCPDVETFAPLIQATFGVEREDREDEENAARVRLRVRIADRSLRQTNPLLSVVSLLLELAEARLTVSQVLDLVDREPVRRRFGFDDAALQRLEEWVAESGACWGLDAEHRTRYGLDEVAAGTWEAALDRLALGVAMAEENARMFGGVLPLDDVDSVSIDLAGRFAELMERLRAAMRELAAPHTLEGWIEAVVRAADALTATAPRDAWQRAELQALLFDLREESRGDGEGEPSPVELELADVRSLLADRLAGRPTRTSFRTGHLTVCSFQPMRSVPHRMVCLLGLDDELFQRRGAGDGDDLLLKGPLIGDRDRRSEDRQILLDALMAATDRFVVTYTGRSERTNVPLSPAAPVAVLLDVVDRTVQLDDGWSARRGVAHPRDAVTLEHPLQPFAERNFAIGALLPDRAWSFDRAGLDGARALLGEREERPPFFAEPLAPLASPLLTVDDLAAFVGNPTRFLLARRLGIRNAGRGGKIEDALPLALDPFEQLALGERLLAARFAGVEHTTAIAAERARGTLPPGVAGDQLAHRLASRAEHVARVAERHGATGGGETAEVRVELPCGRVLAGSVTGIVGSALWTIRFARVSPADRLASWVRLLAVTAADPERLETAVTVGRGRRGSDAGATVATIGPLPAASAQQFARDELAALVTLFDRGMREPLPLYPETSAAYAAYVAEPTPSAGTREARAREARRRAVVERWQGRFRVPGENAAAEHLLALGGQRSFNDMWSVPPLADESGDGWAEQAPSRFARYARRWWDVLLRYEHLEDA